MNNLSKFTAEVLFTTVVASLVSLVVAVCATWLLNAYDSTINGTTVIYFVTGLVFGLMVGYKLRNIVDDKPATKKKKKK